MSVKFTKLTPTIQVHSLDEGIAFYEKLGFKAQWKWPDDQPTHSSLAKDEISFMITSVEKEKGIQKADLYFWVNDVEEYHRKVKGSGVDLPDLVKTDYGMLDTSIVDPWGNHLTFGEPKGEYNG